MKIEVVNYDDGLYRNQVIKFWGTVFRYHDHRNNPALVIDKKIKMHDDLFFIAINGELVVGTVMAGYDGHRGWIYSLAVMESMRKVNIGKKLLRHAEKALTELGCVKINLQLLEKNVQAKGFYEKCGYHVEVRISMGKEIRSNLGRWRV